MWETPFEPSLLTAKEGVVIRCPDEMLSHELFGIFNENGVQWDGAESMERTNWDRYGKDTCYYVRLGRLKYGTSGSTNVTPYSNYIKSTFFGVDMPDFEVANDDELRSFLGI